MRIERKMFCLIIVAVLLIPQCQSGVPDNYTQSSTATLLPNIHQLGYSHNQRMLVVIQEGLQGLFYVYDGIRLTDPQKVLIKDQRKPTASPSSFMFNQDDSLLVVGTQEGSLFGYNVDKQGKVRETWSYNMSYGSTQERFTVKSISIDQNNNIAVGVKEHIYVLAIPDQQKQEQGILPKLKQSRQFVNVTEFQFVHLVQSVCWSVQPNTLIVGTFGISSGNFSLFYTNNKTEKQINTDKTQFLALSFDGKFIFKSTVDKNIEVYDYIPGDIPKLKTTIPDSNSSTKIITTSDGKYLAATVKGAKTKAWKITPDQSHLQIHSNQKPIRNLQLTITLNFEQPSSTFTLSPLSNDLLLIPTTPISQTPHYTLCPTQTYLSSQPFDCLPCSNNCNTCFTSSVCISCTNDKFIDGDICSQCNTKLNGCLTCQNKDKCLTCNENQFWNKNPDTETGKCTCQTQYYDSNGQCKNCNAFLDCFTCKAQNYCDTCKNQANFDPDPVQGKCQCKTSFWLNNTQCAECIKSIPDCIDCSQNGSTCYKCQSQDRTPSPDKSKCQCTSYRYEDQDGNCQFCDRYQLCLQCQPTNPQICLKCDSNKNRKNDPEQGKCVCQDGFYDNQEGTCIECSASIPDCGLCQNKDFCQSCKNQSNFDPTPKQGKCVCLSGWILVDRECSACSKQIIGCKTCSSTTKCDLCNKDQNFVQTPTAQGKCTCKSSYWFDGQLCQPCSSKIRGCDTCSTDGSQCLSCKDPNRQPNKNGDSCICKDFYFENATEECQLCDIKQSCIHCNQTDPAHKCIDCDPVKHWNATPSDGICICQTGYNEYDGKCVLCMVKGCVQCQTQTTCNRCDGSKNFDPTPQHDTCNCIPGTYKSQDKLSCLNCSTAILGCKQCFNGDDCSLCDSNKHFTENSVTNKCDCMKAFYLKNNLTCEECGLNITNCVECVTNGNSVDCTACKKGWGTSANKKSCIDCGKLSVGCVDCSDSGHCTKCDEDAGFELKDNACVCKKGLFEKNGGCLNCTEAIPGCNACDSESTCTECTNQNNFSPTPDLNHKCQCVAGWTLSNKECVSCTKILGCRECSSTQACTKCDSDHFFEPAPQNKCQCKATYWLNATQCQECNTAIYDCKLCSSNGKSCSECTDPMRQLNKDKTQCDCVKFTYQTPEKKCAYCDDYKVCVSCDPEGDHQCKQCDTQNFWNLKPNVDGVCTCQSGYTEYSHSCILCQVTGCTQCQQTNNCSSCSTQNRFDPAPTPQGKCQCQPETIFDTDKCYFCNQKLLGCTKCGNFSECITCNSDQFFVLNNQTKKCQCDSLHYLVVDTCKPCSEGIKYCEECEISETKKQCKKCKKGFEPSEDNSTCLNCEDLIIGCDDCSDMNTCQECDLGRHFVFNEGRTQCICDKGWFLRLRDCLECKNEITGCLECSQDGGECTNCNKSGRFVLDDQSKKCICEDGYFLKEGQCLNCSGLLPGCNVCSQDGGKCLECSKGFYLSEDKCNLCSSTIPGCTLCQFEDSIKTQKTNSYIQQQLTCSQCNTANFILNENTKKCDCIPTYFLKEKECVLCDSQFTGCNICTADECQQCKPDHFVFINQTKQCLCESGYFLNETDKKCDLCESKIPGCTDCTQNGNECNKCDQKKQFIIDNTTHQCNCNQGFFIDQGLCSTCDSKTPGCTHCSQQGTNCTSCDTNNNFIFDQTNQICICKQSYFIASNTKCELCSQAITYCETCTSTKSDERLNNGLNLDLTTTFTPQCSKCKDTFELSPSKTSCLCSGTDKEITNGQCVDKPKFNWPLWAGIIGGFLAVIAITAFVLFKWKKAKSRVNLEQEEEQDQESNKRSKQATLLTSENNSAGLLRSSGSLDIDE